jgi:type I restriction enzyme, S subunit
MPFYQGKKEFGSKFIQSPTTWTTSPTKIARRDDILMSVRAPVGPVNIAVQQEVCIGRGLAALRCKAPLSRDFLYYQLLHMQPRISGRDGAVFASISKTDIEQLPIDFVPESEQRRLVAILDEAFASIAIARDNAEKNLRNARELFDSGLDAVFAPNDSQWVEKTMGELVSDGVLHKPFDGNHGEIHPTRADYTKSGVPFIMAADLQNGQVNTTDCKFISRKQADKLRVGFAQDGDVLISHKGTIGRSAIVCTTDDYIMLTPQVTAYRVKDSAKLLNRFVRYHFMSPGFQREMISAAEDGSTRAYIGITKQLNLRLRFPLIAKQREIVSALDRLMAHTQRLESTYQRKLAALDELRQSLLHDTFSGKL